MFCTFIAEQSAANTEEYIDGFVDSEEVQNVTGASDVDVVAPEEEEVAISSFINLVYSDITFLNVLISGSTPISASLHDNNVDNDLKAFAVTATLGPDNNGGFVPSHVEVGLESFFGLCKGLRNKVGAAFLDPDCTAVAKLGGVIVLLSGKVGGVSSVKSHILLSGIFALDLVFIKMLGWSGGLRHCSDPVANV